MLIIILIGLIFRITEADFHVVLSFLIKHWMFSPIFSLLIPLRL